MQQQNDYDHLIDLIQKDAIAELEEASELLDDFPHGKDTFVERHWITNIIECGTYEVLVWGLSKKVNLDFRDDEG